MKKLAGIPAAPGIAKGKAFLQGDNDFPGIERRVFDRGELAAELARLDTAYAAAEKEIAAIYETALREAGAEQAAIFSAHVEILRDPEIREQVEGRISAALENAEWVIQDVAQTLTRVLLSSPDPLFRERAADITDVSQRILKQLLGFEKEPCPIPDWDVILAARDLLPSEILTMNKTRVKGLVLAQGGQTSHTAILARALNIPAVLGLSAGLREISANDDLIVDGTAGEVIINPNESEVLEYQAAGAQLSKAREDAEKFAALPAQTRDGRLVAVKANIGIPGEAETARRFGAGGIGLFRSEFLFLDRGRSGDTAADEEAQFQAYREVLETMGELPVTIRTADIGGDKTQAEFETSREDNPLLGWRAIRVSLARPDFFKTQLRALLRAGVRGNLRIMFPMISGIEELDQALGLLDEAKTECRKKGRSYAETIETGIMIEIPSAAVIADILVKKADFVSIGTNDLVQYALAADRGNEKVNYLTQPLHPAVIRFLKMVIDASHKQGIKAAMCGEMAGDPEYTALLLGLGLDEFSMNVSSIPRVKKLIRELSAKDSLELADRILLGTSAAENSAVNKAWLKERGWNV